MDKKIVLPEIKKIIKYVSGEKKKGFLPSLFIQGTSKSGKSFLLNSLKKYYSSEIFYVAQLPNPPVNILKIHIKKNKALLLDDFHLINSSSVNILKLLLFYIKSNRPIVITSSFPLDKLNLPDAIKKGISRYANFKLSSITPQYIYNLLYAEAQRKQKVFIKDKAIMFAKNGSLDNIYKWMENNFPDKEGAKKESDIINSLIEEIKEDMVQNNDEDEKREFFVERLYIWEMKGFNVEPLKNMIGGPMDILEKAFDDYMERVNKLVELHKRFGQLNLKYFTKSEVSKIEDDLFDPYKIDEVEKAINSLEQRFQIVRKLSNTLKKEYDEYNYIIENSNQEAYDMVDPLLTEGRLRYNPLMIVGDSGTGKSHLLHFIVLRWRKLKASYRSVYLSPTDFANVLKNNMDVFTVFDLFCIDDFDVFIKQNSKDIKVEISSFINKLLSQNKQLIISVSNQAVLSLANVEHYFPSSHIVVLKEPDSSIRRGVIGRLCRDMSININSEAMNYLATTSQVPLSEMYDVITQIAREAKDKTEIDVQTIETILNTGLTGLSGDITGGIFTVDTELLIDDWDDNKIRIYME